MLRMGGLERIAGSKKGISVYAGEVLQAWRGCPLNGKRLGALLHPKNTGMVAFSSLKQITRFAREMSEPGKAVVPVAVYCCRVNQCLFHFRTGGPIISGGVFRMPIPLN